MYIPPHFRNDDREQLVAFMQAHPFAVITSNGNEIPFATHLPFVTSVENEKLFLTGHFSAANPHAKAIENGDSVLVIFSGPNGYVSPSLYEKRENVPTWNYIAVHATGIFRLKNSADDREKILRQTILHFEPGYFAQWESLDKTYTERLLNGIVAFEIEIRKLEGKYKLSQNKTEEEQQRVADSFHSNALNSSAAEMAQIMLHNINSKKKRMKTFLTAPALFLTLALSAQLPNSEVWVFESDLLTGSHTIGKGINVSNHPGYDNEPSFPPNSKFLLWSSECDPGQTDICYYDFDDDSVMRITHTKVSEYSPAYMFGGQFISAVVVEADSTQRMWKYDYDRGAGQVMFPRVTGVAYYTWFDKQFVVMDQLTQNDSMNLLVGDAKAGVARLCVRNVGRCVQCYNSSSVKKILYTKEDTIGKFFIHAMFISGNNYDDFDPIPMLPGSQDFAVDYNGDILAAKGTELYIWNINTSDNWEKIADFSASGLHSITRIAISPDGRWVAVVDNP